MVDPLEWPRRDPACAFPVEEVTGLPSLISEAVPDPRAKPWPPGVIRVRQLLLTHGSARRQDRGMGTAEQRPTGPVNMTVGQWLVVDAVFDNEVHSRVHGQASAEEVLAARSIREAGWAWNRTVDDSRKDSLGWAPRDEIVNMTLEPSQWSLVLSVLHKWNELEKDNHLLDLAELVSAQLPGLSGNR